MVFAVLRAAIAMALSTEAVVRVISSQGNVGMRVGRTRSE